MRRGLTEFGFMPGLRDRIDARLKERIMTRIDEDKPFARDLPDAVWQIGYEVSSFTNDSCENLSFDELTDAIELSTARARLGSVCRQESVRPRPVICANGMP
jgi:hypothetical protein